MKMEPSKSPKASILWLFGMALLSLVLMQESSVRYLLVPLELLDTTLHEMGHAIFCIATGGTVHGLTVVSDGDGHAGLTMTRGGIPFIFNQTGYLGTTLFGCIMIALGRSQAAARGTLIGLGVVIALGSVFFVTQTFFLEGRIGQAAGSFVVAMALALVLIFAGYRFSDRWAQIVLLFLGVHIGINALTDIIWLSKLSLGLVGAHSFTDATNMAQLTGFPAAFWSLLWGLLSLVMLVGTVKLAYASSDK
ncbi:M50 family metallopeptidase [soil metagenome]